MRRVRRPIMVLLSPALHCPGKDRGPPLRIQSGERFLRTHKIPALPVTTVSVAANLLLELGRPQFLRPTLTTRRHGFSFGGRHGFMVKPWRRTVHLSMRYDAQHPLRLCELGHTGQTDFGADWAARTGDGLCVDVRIYPYNQKRASTAQRQCRAKSHACGVWKRSGGAMSRCSPMPGVAHAATAFGNTTWKPSGRRLSAGNACLGMPQCGQKP
jgi:hypothetical protein